MKPKTQAIVPAERIESRILLIRSHKIMLDSDLAQLYGVTTKRLNEQVKRNRDRFPADFMFRLRVKEKNEVVANCDYLRRLKFSRALPLAFTEHGAIMAASVLNTPRAVEASVHVVRTFVKLREVLRTHKELARKLGELEGADQGTRPGDHGPVSGDPAADGTGAPVGQADRIPALASLRR